MLQMDTSGPSVSDVFRSTTQQMDLKTAARRVHQRHLPHEVTVLVEATAEGRSKQPFSEESMEKARLVLNEMVESAWRELDDKVIECKEYEEQNRGTYDQVVADLARLASQLGDLQRMDTESESGIAQKDQEIRDAEDSLAHEQAIYEQIHASNEAEMMTRTNDLDVFTFVLQFTKCADATSLLQRGGSRICETQSGIRIVRFDDPAIQSKYEHMSTPK